MNKIKIAFASLAAIAGIGGAYAATGHLDSRAGTIFNWYTAGGTFQVSGTTVQLSGVCTGGASFCLRGTAVVNNKPVVLTIHKR